MSLIFCPACGHQLHSSRCYNVLCPWPTHDDDDDADADVVYGWQTEIKATQAPQKDQAQEKKEERDGAAKKEKEEKEENEKALMMLIE